MTIFRMGEALFALPMNVLREIIDHPKIIKVPLDNQCILGIINVRGEVLPLVDFLFLLRGIKTEIPHRAPVLILESVGDGEKEPFTVAIIAQKVLDISDVTEGMIQNLPYWPIGLEPDFISGVFKHNDEFVFILNHDSCLNPKLIIKQGERPTLGVK